MADVGHGRDFDPLLPARQHDLKVSAAAHYVKKKRDRGLKLNRALASSARAVAAKYRRRRVFRNRGVNGVIVAINAAGPLACDLHDFQLLRCFPLASRNTQMNIVIQKLNGLWHLIVGSCQIRTPFLETQDRALVVTYARRVYPGARIFEGG